MSGRANRESCPIAWFMRWFSSVAVRAFPSPARPTARVIITIDGALPSNELSNEGSCAAVLFTSRLSVCEYSLKRAGSGSRWR